MNEDTTVWYNDKKYVPYYFIGALFFFLLGAYFFWGGSAQEKEVLHLQMEQDMLRAYEAQPIRREKKDFLVQAFPSKKQNEYVSLLESVGLSVKDVTEETGKKNEWGDFHKIFISGTGSFSQILSGFDIIKSEERWNAVNLKEMKRSEEGLAFEMEIVTFQYRGMYEKEKYRPDRSDGDREEPRRENSR